MKSIRIAILPLIACVLVLACLGYFWGSGRELEEFKQEHKHHHQPPHGGALIELGDHIAHIELLHDPESATLTAYLLDGHAEHPVRVPDDTLAFEIRLDGSGDWVPVKLAATASALTGETKGDTSEFKAEVSLLRGKGKFAVRTPSLTIFGVNMDAVETRYPEGSE